MNPLHEQQVSTHGLKVSRLSDIQAKPIAWLWHGRIAQGKCTVLAGAPGLGKSQITASMAAVITTGGVWPDGQGTQVKGGVLFICAEDSPTDTLRPRLEAAGADIQRCHFLEAVKGATPTEQRTLDLSKDMERISQYLSEHPEIKLVVIDPITAYMGNLDQNKNADVRRMMTQLTFILEQSGVAALFISHLNKTDKRSPLDRVLGSIGLVAAARSVWLVTKDPTNPRRRFLGCAKNNLGADHSSTGLAFSVVSAVSHGGIETSKVAWETEAVEVNLENLLAQSTLSGNAEPKAIHQAQAFLMEALAKGPEPAKDMYEGGIAHGISKRTLERAKDILGIEVQKLSPDAGGIWVWNLPKAANAHQDRQTDSGDLEQISQS